LEGAAIARPYTVFGDERWREEQTIGDERWREEQTIGDERWREEQTIPMSACAKSRRSR
jgi:hypothetical protein